MRSLREKRVCILGNRHVRETHLEFRAVFEPFNVAHNVLKEVRIHHRPSDKADQLAEVLLSFFKVLQQPMPQDLEGIILRGDDRLVIVKHSH